MQVISASFVRKEIFLVAQSGSMHEQTSPPPKAPDARSAAPNVRVICVESAAKGQC